MLQSAKDNCLKISAYYFNSTCSRDSYNIALNYSICYNVFSMIFKCGIKLFFKVVTSDESLKNSLRNKLYRRVINSITKELREDSYLIELLKANNLDRNGYIKFWKEWSNRRNSP